MKVLTVVGARPQFIKAAPVSRALREAGHTEVLVHTGQHYDYNMSQVFFEEMGIPKPDFNLEVGSGPHGWQTGQMLMRLEEVMQQEQPARVLVYGDTNSTLAGALSACKLRLPLAHVEAGLRSFNREMPEEHNRVLTDHCSDMLFCPTETAVKNLSSEGLREFAFLVGDTMYDAVLSFTALAGRNSDILNQLNLEPGGYLLATLHRPYNTDVTESLRAILAAFAEIEETIVFPVHPRSRQRITELYAASGLEKSGRVKFIDPVGYLDMLMLERHARMILTDSGGIQKEAFFFAVPCVTLRPETEWVETTAGGWNKVVGSDRERILEAVRGSERPQVSPPDVFGDGRAAEKIVARLTEDVPG
jgi:UDP-GlcNAc3NAcA epimerase